MSHESIRLIGDYAWACVLLISIAWVMSSYAKRNK